MRREALVLGAALLLCAGCSSAGRVSADSPTSAATTVAATTLPAVTTTSGTGINPDVIPSVITVPYVNAVFKVLEHLDGDVLRDLVASDRVTATSISYLRAIYNDPLYQQEVTIAHQTVSSLTANVRNPPGDIVLRVVKLWSTSSSCIFASTTSDYSAVLIKSGPSPASSYFGLDLKPRSANDRRLNPTPWAIFFNAVFMIPTTIPNQCANH